MIRRMTMLLVFTVAAAVLFAQEPEPAKKKKDWSKVNLSNRPKDHLMFQAGYLQWMQAPDSITTKGLSRSINLYFSFDFIFKTNPCFSIGLGAGIGTDQVSFDKASGRNLDIKNPTAFRYSKHSGADTANRYRGVKLTTSYLEAPVELRFTSNPENPNKSFKIAVGMKVGTLVGATHKTRFDIDGNGNPQYNMKIKDKKHFNNIRLAPTFRIGYGNIGLFAQYQLNDFIREGQGPNQIKPFTVGLTLSGL
jgi:hypothetical protein